jgi:hypothetical protein
MPVIREQGEFTKNWTRWKRDNWEKYLIPYQPPILTMLEIGVHEGRSACWFLDHLLTPSDARYIGIDAWDAMLLLGMLCCFVRRFATKCRSR